MSYFNTLMEQSLLTALCWSLEYRTGMSSNSLSEQKRAEMDRYNDGDDDGKWIADYLAEDSFNELMERGHRQFVREVLSQNVTSSSSVLSIGAGSGEWLRESVAVHSPRNSIALDVSRVELQRGKSETNGEKLEWICGDAERLPVQDNSIDFVLAAAVLHHLPKWESMILNEVCRVLRPDGVFLFFDPLRYNPFALFARRFLETRERTDAEVPLDPFSLRSTLADSFEAVELAGFYVLSPVCTLLDDVLPVDLTEPICQLSRLERKAAERGAFPLAAEVVGVARNPR